MLAHPQRCAYPIGYVKTITGQEATRQGILDGLDWLQAHIQEDASGNATAVVYYTGHGWRDASGVSYLLPYDVREGQFGLWLRALQAEGLAAAVGALQPRRATEGDGNISVGAAWVGISSRPS